MLQARYTAEYYQPFICTFSCTAHFISLHILPLIYFIICFYFILTIFVYIYIYLSRVLFHSFYCFYVIFILLLCFFFLHFPLSGPVLTNISLLIIPCMIVYVTNNKEPWPTGLTTSSLIIMYYTLIVKHYLFGLGLKQVYYTTNMLSANSLWDIELFWW